MSSISCKINRTEWPIHCNFIAPPCSLLLSLKLDCVKTMSLLPKSQVKMRGIITTLSIANWTKAITGIKVIETWGIHDRFCFRWLLVNEPVKGFSCPMSPYKVIRLRNPGNSCFWNQKSWNFKSVIQLKESRSPLAIGIWNPSFTDKESVIHYLESGIRNLESRILDCLVFPYKGRF